MGYMTIFWLISVAIIFSVLAPLLVILFKNKNYNAKNNSPREAMVKIVVALGLACGLPTLTYLLYQNWGNSDKLTNFYAATSAEQLKKIKQLQLVAATWSIKELRARIATELNPQDGQAWWQLSNLYMIKRDSAAAAKALAAAYQLAPENNYIFIYYLIYTAQQNNGLLPTEHKAKLKKLLRYDQYKAYALNLLAIDSFKTKAYADAANYWRQLLQTLPADDPELAATRHGIEQMLAQTLPAKR